MRLNHFDLNQVVCLEALLSECSVTRAAQRVHLSQSAMSTVLARLREHFDDPLLVRSGRKLVPTPFARDLRQPVQEFLAQAQALTALSPDQAPVQVDRELTIAASDYAMSAYLGEAIRRTERPMPKLRFDILPLSDHSADLLRNGEIDLMVAGQALDAGRPPNETLCEDIFVCLVSRGHEPPGRVLDADAFLSRRHVVVRYFESQMTFEDEEALRRQGLRRPRHVAVWSQSLVPQLISGTSMIATVTWRLAQQFAERWPLEVYPFPFAQDPM
ncbi:MAG: LysR family transcriptional regulator, partial [Alphaproteobacteria bacterium]|nr:LysR family transcriptional regulator [Alphaproteobacteria bacterium]